MQKKAVAFTGHRPESLPFGRDMHSGRYDDFELIPEKILLDLIASVLGISPMLDDQEALDRIHHIEMHPKNRVLFVFQDGHTEEHFWKDHSRRDSWDAEKRKKAAEKTKEQRKRRKEQTAQ